VSMSLKQRRILTGMAAAVAFTAAVMWFGATQLSVAPGVPENRLSFVLGWLLLPGLCLLAGVARVATIRFFDPAAIDGAAPAPGSPLDIDLRYIRNTLEQVVLASIGWTVLAIALPSHHLGVIPVLAISFFFARGCFWIGYHRSGPARAFGFAATFYPTVAAYLWTLYLFFSR
jgi:uncharacterized membrane protein YecN with MAPEG domain